MTKRSLNGSKGSTPGKPKSKIAKCQSKIARKSLFGKENEPPSEAPSSDIGRKWEDAEIAALIQYIGLYYEDSVSNGWPTTKNPSFWSSCASAIADNTGCFIRSGGSCRTRVLKHLKKKYSLSEAEEVYGVNYIESLPSQSNNSHTAPIQPLSPIFGHSPSTKEVTGSSHIGDILSSFISLYKEKLSIQMKRQLLNYLLKVFIEQEYGLEALHFMKGNMLDVIISGMLKLFSNKKENIVYKLAQIVSEDKLKLDRMPYGLLDYNIKFFAADSTVKFGMESHYIDWQTTMLAHFGHKWVALNRGPMWTYEEEDTNHDESDLIKQDHEAMESHPAPGQTNSIISEALMLSGIEESLSDIIIILEHYNTIFIC